LRDAAEAHQQQQQQPDQRIQRPLKSDPESEDQAKPGREDIEECEQNPLAECRRRRGDRLQANRDHEGRPIPFGSNPHQPARLAPADRSLGGALPAGRSAIDREEPIIGGEPAGCRLGAQRVEGARRSQLNGGRAARVI
jgi:hypothetical protein